LETQPHKVAVTLCAALKLTEKINYWNSRRHVLAMPMKQRPSMHSSLQAVIVKCPNVAEDLLLNSVQKYNNKMRYNFLT